MIEQSIDSPYIHSASADTLQQLVIDNFRKGPILINFWSRKTRPCLKQYPALDKLIYNYSGKVLLIRIDTDRDYIFSSEYGITSVPILIHFNDSESSGEPSAGGRITNYSSRVVYLARTTE